KSEQARLSTLLAPFWAATDLWQLAAVLAQARLVIANDSGPLHLAAVLGRVVLGLYGPSQWRRTYPLARQALMIKKADLDCLACRLRVCPKPNHPCMTDLAPQSVLAAVRILME